MAQIDLRRPELIGDVDAIDRQALTHFCLRLPLSTSPPQLANLLLFLFEPTPNLIRGHFCLIILLGYVDLVLLDHCL